MLYAKKDNIGSYIVTFQHKKGSYAETYRVKDSNGKTRFLKLINYAKLSRHQIDDNGRVIEVEISKFLNHHNLCSFIDSGNVMVNGGQATYLVTEFISGETLAQRIIREDKLSVYDIKKIAKSVLSALDYIHNLDVPIVHGEVTIQNIMLNLVGGLEDLKLIDFGHARFLNQSPAKPDLNELNPFYLAPERFSGVCQIQSDIYSVGVMIYHLLYGELPWFFDTSRVKGDKVEQILAERGKPLKIPSTDIFELDEQFINCIAKALSYDVEDRFQSAKEFVQAIDGEIKVDCQETRKKVKSGETKKKVNNDKTFLPHKSTGPGFSAIAGMQDLKDLMQKEVIDALNNSEEYARYGLTIPNGMLLYGPPGCGKTFFAKHFAEEVGFNYMEVKPSTLKSRYVNATQENIGNMFDDARKNAPTIIFIDEMNELVPNRDSNDVHEMSRSAVNEMLAQMDRTGEDNVFVIGATNYPNMIDPAILRAGRLDKKFYIGPPDKEARESILKMYLSTRPYDFGIDYSHLADLTEGYVSADLKKIIDDASRSALVAHSKITQHIIEGIIHNTLPSIPANELKKYIQMKADLEGKNQTGIDDKGKNKRPIGFR